MLSKSEIIAGFASMGSLTLILQTLSIRLTHSDGWASLGHSNRAGIDPALIILRVCFLVFVGFSSLWRISCLSGH